MLPTFRRLLDRLFRPSRLASRNAQRRTDLRLEILEARLALSGLPTTYYVATNGNDGNNGTLQHPFATVQQALSVAKTPGDTISIEGGTYHQQATLSSLNSGNAQQAITLTNYNGQHVIIDGSGDPAGTGGTTTLDARNASYVTISGLEIRNTQSGQDAEGITIDGNCSHVTLSNNNIDDIKGQGAYGIYVNGTVNARGTLSNLTITNNQIHDIQDTNGTETFGIYLHNVPPSWATTANIQNVTVSNNQVYNLTTTAGNVGEDLSGVRVEGAASNVTLSGNVIHNINLLGSYAWSKLPQASDKTNVGMGITVYDNSKIAISTLTISNNEVYACQLGLGEALTLNGNVNGFTVKDNKVHDVSNIGIDCIGGDPGEGSWVTRNGTVSQNTVYNAHSRYDDNPNPHAYIDGFAAGIYVDGGQNILVTNNVSYSNDEGLEVGAENANATASGITVSYNVIYDNTKVGLKFGGFDSTAGSVTKCTFDHNTVYNNDCNDPNHDNEGQLDISRASNCVVSNNIFDALGKEVLILWEPSIAPNQVKDQFFNNLYDAANASAFTWTIVQNGQSTLQAGNFAAWKAFSGQDANSLFANPDFVNAAAAPPNFQLAAGSPAIGAGTGGTNMGAF
jgi:hypothetical protein